VSEADAKMATREAGVKAVMDYLKTIRRPSNKEVNRAGDILAGRTSKTQRGRHGHVGTD
jgi:hypothetical protein